MSALRCKPGDLAVVITSFAGNEGKFVEVIRSLGVHPFWRGEYWCNGQGHVWLCKSAGSQIKAMYGASGMEMPIADNCLRPIRPSAEPESTETREELTA